LLRRLLLLTLSLLLSFQGSAFAQLRCDSVFLDWPSEGPLEKLNRAYLMINQWSSGDMRVHHSRGGEPWYKSEPKRALQYIYNNPLQLINPLPIHTSTILKWDAPANPIFSKMWKNPKYSPTEAERNILKKYGVEERFDTRQKFLQEHGNWYKVRRALSYSYRSGLWMAFFLQLYFATQSEQNFVDANEYIADQDKGDLRVEIISETTPFPHVALRIGRRVYSYGVDRLSVSTVAEYFNPKMQPDGTWIPRVVQSIELNLTAEQVSKLKDDLESRRANVYHNITFVNDCATMIARALKRNNIIDIPVVVDASPAAMIQYLSVLKIKGDKRIGEFRQVQVGGEKSAKTMTARNFYINAVEARIWKTSFYLNLPMRMMMDQVYDESNIEFRDPAVQQALDEYIQAMEAEVRGSLEVLGLQAQIDEAIAGTTFTAAEAQKLNNEISEVIKALRAPEEATLNTPGMDLLDHESANAKVILLNTIENEFLEKVKNIKDLKGRNL
jgi:hypothetical protein